MFKTLRFVSMTAVGVLFAAPTLGQTFEVKDQHGSVVLTISTVKMFRTSGHDDLPVFQGVVKNVSGCGLTLDTVKGTVHKKDGSTVEFTFGVCDVRWCDFSKDSVLDVSRPFPKSSFTPATFDSVTFEVSWERISAEDQAKMDVAQAERDAAEAQAKKDAAEAARQKRLEVAEQARLRAACSVIYRSTANKKVSDLTVKEEQQVRACQVLGLYPPQ